MTIDLTRSIPIHQPLAGPGSIGNVGGIGKTGSAPGKETTFAEVLKGYVEGVSSLERAADIQLDGVAKGQAADPHEVMMAVQEANLALDMMIEIRNKLLEAYRELIRTSV